MKVSDVKQGTIFQVPLQKRYGFAYVLLLYGRNLNSSNILKTIDHFSLTNDYGDTKLDERNFIFTPSLLTGLPKLRGAEGWKIVGYKAVDGHDSQFPDFKLCYQLNEIVPGRDLTELTWYRVRNLDPRNSNVERFDSIKHLGFFAELNYRLISMKLTMEWMIKNGEDVRNWFTEEDFENTLGLSMVYAQVLGSKFLET